MLFSGIRLKPLLWILTWIALIAPPLTPAVCANDTDPLPALSRLMKEFMVRHQVPGAALAITRNNRLIYAEGFGYTDREHKFPVVSRSLFRIASVSKPITATAILQLVEQDLFRLDDPVLPLLNPTLRDAPGVPGDPHLQAVTIRHLLQHRAGWDRAQSRFFPLRSNSLGEICQEAGIAAPGTPDTVVRYMLSRPLDFTPGARYAYANIGYLVLGRVVESVTGQSYESYVNKHLLVPLGIQDMRIGSSTPESSAPGEVCYYTAFNATIEAQFGPQRGQKVPVSYSRSIEVQEAAGGWVASVVDLARFVTALYAPDDIAPLEPETLQVMITATPSAQKISVTQKSNGYALGWYVEHDDQGRTIVHHTGHLPGTGAFLGRRSDGIGVAVLFNSDTNPQNDLLIRLFLAELAPAIDSLSSWPQHDLFPIYFPGKQ